MTPAELLAQVAADETAGRDWTVTRTDGRVTRSIARHGDVLVTSERFTLAAVVAELGALVARGARRLTSQVSPRDGVRPSVPATVPVNAELPPTRRPRGVGAG